MHFLVEVHGQVKRVFVHLRDVELVAAAILQSVHRRLQLVGVIGRLVNARSLALKLALVTVEHLQYTSPKIVNKR